MHLSWLVKIRSVFYSLSLHIIAAVLLVFSFSFTETIQPPPAQNRNVVNAVAVDRSEVEKELKRLHENDQKKKLEEQNRIKELEKQAEQLKKQRQEEENKLQDAKKKKEEERKRREEEQKKLTQLKKEKEELEQQRKIEEEKKKKIEAEKRKAEEEKKRLEEEKKKREAELKQQEEERKKAEAEKKRKEAEKALQEQLAAEQAEEQRKQDLTLQQQIARDIYNRVTRNFNQTGLPDGLSCALRVKLLPGGEVIDVSVSKSSGNDIFDRRALTAVQKASPLPVPEDLATFERLNLRDITFTFKP